jgi:hypothetical protein
VGEEGRVVLQYFLLGQQLCDVGLVEIGLLRDLDGVDFAELPHNVAHAAALPARLRCLCFLLFFILCRQASDAPPARIRVSQHV